MTQQQEMKRRDGGPNSWRLAPVGEVVREYDEHGNEVSVTIAGVRQ